MGGNSLSRKWPTSLTKTNYFVSTMLRVLCISKLKQPFCQFPENPGIKLIYAISLENEIFPYQCLKICSSLLVLQKKKKTLFKGYWNFGIYSLRLKKIVWFSWILAHLLLGYFFHYMKILIFGPGLSLRLSGSGLRNNWEKLLKLSLLWLTCSTFVSDFW